MISNLLLTLLLCLWSVPAWAAVTVGPDASADSGTAVGASPTIASFTCTNDDTVLVVTICTQEATATVATVSTLTYGTLNKAAAALAGSDITPDTGNASKVIYRYLWKPGATVCNGVAKAVNATLSASRFYTIAIEAFDGVDQTTPADAAVVNESAGADPAPCGAVTTATGDLVSCAIALQNSNTTIVTPIVNGTLAWQEVTTNATPSSNIRAASAWTTGTGSQTITFDLSAAVVWTTVAFNLNAAAATSTLPPQSGQFLRFFDDTFSPDPLRVLLLRGIQ